MPYVIKKIDGNIVATVTDGTVDSSSTSLTLIGKNYKGIGEIYNTNLVYLLENFANSSPPNNQVRGQTWFNTSSNKLNVYDGSSWRPVGSPFVTNSRPGNLVQGDLWIDSASQQLKFFDGANLITAGPIYTANQGKTGWEVEEIVDSRGNTQIVASMYVSNVRMAILNTVAFVPLLPIDGFTTGTNSLKAGLSFSTSVLDNNINAPAQTAQTLIDPIDGELATSKFVRSDKSSSILGSLTLAGTASAGGLTLGPDSNVTLYVDMVPSSPGYLSTFLTNQVSNRKLVVQTRSSAGFHNAIELDPATKKVTVYQGDLWATVPGVTPELVVNGNATVQGTLTVVGATTFTNSTTLQITDKNIELAVVGTPSNATADGAGITVHGGVNNNKTITWSQAGITRSISPLITLPCWQVNDNFRIPGTSGYYVANDPVLNTTTLGETVINSSLTSVGTLIDLNVSKFNFTDNVLSIVEPLTNLEINVPSGQMITLTNRVRINNVDTPSLPSDAATKEYVDQVKSAINYLTLDVTGLATPSTDLLPQLNAMIPPSTVNAGDVVNIMCLAYTNTALPIPNPNVARTVRKYLCELYQGARRWAYQVGQDINIV